MFKLSQSVESLAISPHQKLHKIEAAMGGSMELRSMQYFPNLQQVDYGALTATPYFPTTMEFSDQILLQRLFFIPSSQGNLLKCSKRGVC